MHRWPCPAAGAGLAVCQCTPPSVFKHISLSDLTCPQIWRKKSSFFGEKKRTLGKCSNFFVFQPILIKLILESDLVLNRSFPESFYDLMIFLCSYFRKIDDFEGVQIWRKKSSFFGKKISYFKSIVLSRYWADFDNF